MRGVTAKRLRAIARNLGLSTKRHYVPGAPCPCMGLHRPLTARPLVMVECFRRAYKEAKKVYLGRPITVLCPEGAREQPFHRTVVDSMKEYRAQD